MDTVVVYINPTTGKEYSGGNIDKLQCACDSDPRLITGAFATFRQWISVGRCVRKGEKAAARLAAFTDHAAPDAEKTADGKCSFVRSFFVFGLEQTDALEAGSTTEPEQALAAPVVAQPPPKKLATDRLQEKADRLIAQAEACFADRLQNTPKRLAQAMHKRMDGQRMERAAHIIKAYLHACNGGASILPDATESQIITWAQEAAIYKATPVSNGYHGYHVETTDCAHNEPHHLALRALLDPRACAASAEKIAKETAEAELRNCDFPGFFPTPANVISVMLEQAGDLHGKHVLEPSAGKGDLVQAAFKAGAKSVRSFEIVPKLADYLHTFVRPTGEQVHATQNADFMAADVAPVPVDVVLMNPPFERNQAPAHVRQALRWIKPGGRLVAVMPAGWSEKASATALLDAIDYDGRAYMEIELDAGSFAHAGAFRQTGVSVALLVVS